MLWSILAAGSTRAAEADAPAPVPGYEPVPERRAQVPGSIEEGAAPQHTILALIRTGGIGLRFA